MRAIIVPMALLGVSLCAGELSRAGPDGAVTPSWKHTEKRSDALRQDQVVTKAKAKSTFVVPMDLTPEELGDLDGSWGVGPDSSAGGTYDEGGFAMLGTPLDSYYCDWQPGRTKARWVWHEDYYSNAPTTIMTAKWNTTSLKVTITARRTVFTGGYYFEEGPQVLAPEVVLGFGDLDGDGPAMFYRFQGDLVGEASVRYAGYYDYALWKVSLGGTIPGVPYEPYYDPYGGGGY